MLTLVPLNPALGAEIRGVDLARFSDDEAEIILRAFRAFGLLLFRGQVIDEAQQLRFAHLFGRLSRQGAIQKAATGPTYVSNTRADGTFGVGELLFHSDQCYYPHPMKAIMLYGLEVPAEGGDTLFANATRAYARMPEALRQQIDGLSVRHVFDYGALHYGDAKRQEVQAVQVSAVHPVVSRHPDTGQPILVVNPQTVDRILDVAPAESTTLVDEIVTRIAAPDNVYRHHWRPHDLLVWDNLMLQHARTDFDNTARRTLRRCAIAHDLEPAA
ncbi:MAG: TauD/TfdA family dioxygenase [Rhodospirillaceae bacterium]|nr:TauD/TfdA family dioxygenase [Rhodospirillaceae bacterium]